MIPNQKQELGSSMYMADSQSDLLTDLKKDLKREED